MAQMKVIMKVLAEQQINESFKVLAELQINETLNFWQFNHLSTF